MIGSRIAGILKEKKISQAGLADKIGISRQAVSQWMSGRSRPDISSLNKIATALGVPVSALVEDGPPGAIKLISTPHSIPVYSAIRAGNSVTNDFTGQEIDTIQISEQYLRDKVFSLKISGDSMFPDLSDGEYAIFKPFHTREVPSDKRIYAISVDGWAEWVIKRVRVDPRGLILLISANPAYKIIEVDPSINPVMIHGLLIESRKCWAKSNGVEEPPAKYGE
jgi:transcriptional regulator with XRE-family HTH domain